MENRIIQCMKSIQAPNLKTMKPSSLKLYMLTKKTRRKCKSENVVFELIKKTFLTHFPHSYYHFPFLFFTFLTHIIECLFIIATNCCVHRFCKYCSFQIRNLELFHAFYDTIFHDLLSRTK